MIYEKLQTFFAKYGIEPKKENLRSFIFDCPSCGGNSKLYIEKTNGRSICFKHKTDQCPTVQTPLTKVLSLISNVPYEDIKSIFDEKITISAHEVLEEPLPFVEPIKKFNKKTVVLNPIDKSQYPVGLISVSNLDNEGSLYLHNRGLDVKKLDKYEISYSPQMRRVVFPIIHYGKWYGWQARTIYKDVEPRMYNLQGNWKSHTLMFYDNIINKNFAIVAEGAVSALKFELVGNFVATMGKIISDAQIDLILKAGVKIVYLALDPDAILEMCDVVKKIYDKTNRSVQCYLIKVPDDKEDFGDCSYEECKKAFEMAEPIDLDCFCLYNYQIEKYEYKA